MLRAILAPLPRPPPLCSPTFRRSTIILDYFASRKRRFLPPLRRFPRIRNCCPPDSFREDRSLEKRRKKKKKERNPEGFTILRFRVRSSSVIRRVDSPRESCSTVGTKTMEVARWRFSRRRNPTRGGSGGKEGGEEGRGGMEVERKMFLRPPSPSLALANVPPAVTIILDYLLVGEVQFLRHYPACRLRRLGQSIQRLSERGSVYAVR